MSRAFSAYLDLLRVMAALAVFVSHAASHRFDPDPLREMRSVGHDAVILFFVLSGYVISYVAQEREHTLGAFTVSRIARIYSVAVPALAISYGVQLLLWHLGQVVPAYQLTQPLKYLALFIGFGGDAWFLNEDAFGNIPYWSLFYEVWYYAGFAAAVYLRGWARVVALIAVVLATGPRIWLLAPLWLAGCLVYHLHRRPGPDIRVARLLFLASLLAVGFILIGNPNAAINAWANRLSGGWMQAHLRYSQFVLGDLVTGIAVATNLYAARYAGLHFGWMTRPIVWAASFTFALYLLHYPLLQLYHALDLSMPAMIAAVLCSVVLIGQVTERQKNRLRAALLARLPLVTSGWRYLGRARTG